jgi:S1-C subfamily serine protease
MALVFPVAAREQLVGTAVLLAQHGDHLLFCTALHTIGEFDDVRIAVPPHQGNCALPQTYPVFQTPALAAEVVASNPFADIVLLAAEAKTGPNTPLPRIATAPGQIGVGSDVVVLGYPFAPVGSFLETWNPGSVVALARRQVLEGVTVDELVLSIRNQPGLAGAPVIGRQDGIVHGILRGAFSPPEVMRVGHIPIATDISVTVATDAHYLHDLLRMAKETLGVPDRVRAGRGAPHGMGMSSSSSHRL